MSCVVVVGGAETVSICKATSVAVGMAGRENRGLSLLFPLLFPVPVIPKESTCLELLLQL